MAQWPFGSNESVKFRICHCTARSISSRSRAAGLFGCERSAKSDHQQQEKKNTFHIEVLQFSIIGYSTFPGRNRITGFSGRISRDQPHGIGRPGTGRERSRKTHHHRPGIGLVVFVAGPSTRYQVARHRPRPASTAVRPQASAQLSGHRRSGPRPESVGPAQGHFAAPVHDLIADDDIAVTDDSHAAAVGCDSRRIYFRKVRNG